MKKPGKLPVWLGWTLFFLLVAGAVVLRFKMFRQLQTGWMEHVLTPVETQTGETSGMETEGEE